MGSILIDDVGKLYPLQRRRDLIARRAFGRVKTQVEPFWALRGISASIAAGERVAILGGNGAGKSTLLGIVAGVIAPSEGRVERRGRLSALLELGTGFHPDLTGRENIRLNASLLGLGRAEIAARLDAIVDFAELDRFIDEPLRAYSSGMIARLGFATAIHVEPEILALDEVMAVGDAGFQAKCAARVAEMAASGATLLVVSHQLATVETMCERALWLEGGRLRADGPAREVVGAYREAAAARMADPSGAASAAALG